MHEFHRNTKGKQSRRTHERISLCHDNREGERKEDQSDSKIYFQAEHIGYKELEGGRQRDMKSSKTDNNNHYSSQAKKGNGGETDSDRARQKGMK